MSKDAILNAIRRGLRRGPLPADQRAMLEGRLAQHPRAWGEPVWWSTGSDSWRQATPGCLWPWREA
jgi:hypothetical protein